MKRLNVFVDETGDFGFNKKSSLLYGVSFVVHEEKDNIAVEIDNLNKKLEVIGYTDMVHMTNLIYKRGEYKYFDISYRIKIFNAMYHFARKIPAQYYSLFIDKRYCNNKSKLRKEIIKELNKLIENNLKYFNKFDEIVLYYDNGQEALGNIIDLCFRKFEGYKHIVEFNHKESRLFQVCDMLTFIDKFDYKYNNKLIISHQEKNFLDILNYKKIVKQLYKKRL